MSLYILVYISQKSQKSQKSHFLERVQIISETPTANISIQGFTHRDLFREKV